MEAPLHVLFAFRFCERLVPLLGRDGCEHGCAVGDWAAGFEDRTAGACERFWIAYAGAVSALESRATGCGWLGHSAGWHFGRGWLTIALRTCLGLPGWGVDRLATHSHDHSARIQAMASLHFAIIGCGGITLQNHLPGLALCRDVRVHAVCDAHPATLERARQETGAAVASTDYREIVRRDDIHAVIIATPNVTHAPIALS